MDLIVFETGCKTFTTFLRVNVLNILVREPGIRSMAKYIVAAESEQLVSTRADDGSSDSSCSEGAAVLEVKVCGNLQNYIQDKQDIQKN